MFLSSAADGSVHDHDGRHCITSASIGIMNILRRSDIARHFGTIIPHSLAPRCKIGVFLRLRVVSREMCLHTSEYLFVDRFNALCTDERRPRKAQEGVMSWCNHIRDSGFIWQLFPALSARRRDMLIYDARTGRPRGMTQEYFDKCQSQHLRLGWFREQDGTLRLVL